MLKIEVAYATPQKQKIIEREVESNYDIIDIIKESGIIEHFPEINDHIQNNTINIGVFGKKIDLLKYQLQDRDRLEIYRKLKRTPNQIRLERAKK